ncbi:MAG: helix-hairpin-helix domain-containing protein [Pirellulales bacterium]|nr:helix-hairpin-helix domain-containing protein [Pirellulales bacterium]
MATEQNTIETAESSDKPNPLWLRRADQWGVALLVLLGLAGMVVWWWSHGGFRGELIDIERAEPRQAEFLVDVNRAGWPELAQLPRIGETLARRIVESRERDGPFQTFDDLRRVQGVGPRTLERLRPYLLPLDDDDVDTGNAHSKPRGTVPVKEKD